MNARTGSGLRTAWVVAMLVAAASSATAMVVVKRDFPDLVARAEQIVAGTVTDIAEEPDASGAPWTLVTFSDLTVLKGDAGATLTLRFYGGRTGDTVTRISDMPSFTLGERNVLFVTGNGRTICPLVGVWQGRFNVRFDDTRGTEVVEASNGTPLVGLAAGELIHAPRRATAPTRAMTLDEFRQLIADELAHPQRVTDAVAQ